MVPGKFFLVYQWNVYNKNTNKYAVKMLEYLKNKHLYNLLDNFFVSTIKIDFFKIFKKYRFKILYFFLKKLKF